jgi:uncharacterized protein YndB with AHSA1/START domain
MSPAPIAETRDREIVVERTFDAPRDLVWTAFTEAKHLDQWWGPNGFRNQTSALKLETGGVWRYVMHGPDGKVWPNWIRYQEIVKPERLVYDHGGGESDTPHFHVTITFTAIGQRTRVTMHSLFPSAEALAEVKKFGAVEGGFQTLARLAGHLGHLKHGPTDGAMVLSRVYDAPAKLVFEAWSTAEALKRWWGPKHFDTPTVDLDFKVGGAYRMVMRDPAGTLYPFHGVFKEIVPHSRIVFSAVIEGLNEEVLTIATFVEENGKTLLTVRQDRPKNVAAASGMTEGWSGQMEKLAALLAAG